MTMSFQPIRMTQDEYDKLIELLRDFLEKTEVAQYSWFHYIKPVDDTDVMYIPLEDEKKDQYRRQSIRLERGREALKEYIEYMDNTLNEFKEHPKILEFLKKNKTDYQVIQNCRGHNNFILGRIKVFFIRLRNKEIDYPYDFDTQFLNLNTISTVIKHLINLLNESKKIIIVPKT